MLATTRFVTSHKKLLLDLIKLKKGRDELDALYDEVVKELKQKILKSYPQARSAIPSSVTIEMDDAKITYSPDSITSRFDSERFQKEHPDLYKNYLVPVPKASFIRVTIGGKKK